MDESKEKLSGIYLLPLLIKLFHASNILDPFGGFITNGHSIINQILLGSSYSIALLICFYKIRETFFYLRKFFIIFFLGIYVLFSCLWSLFPISALINFVHFIGIILIIISSCFYFEGRYYNIIQTFMIWGSITVTYSFIIVIIFPNIGIHHSGRWQGAFGHPNQLGIACIIAVWSNFYSFLKTKHISIKIINSISIVTSFYLLLKADSVTSIICSIFAILSLAILVNAKINSFNLRLIILFFMFLGGILAVLVIYAFYPELFKYETLFQMVGRDSSFTDRTNLWESGYIAFKRKFLFGWGFDAGRSIFSQEIIKYGQFHNGYLDLAISGGFISIIIFSIIIIKKAKLILNCLLHKFDATIFFSIFFFVILLHNFTEASFLRPLHSLWFMFVFIYFYLGSQGFKSTSFSK